MTWATDEPNPFQLNHQAPTGVSQTRDLRIVTTKRDESVVTYIFGDDIDAKSRRARAAAALEGVETNSMVIDRSRRTGLLKLILQALDGTLRVLVTDASDLPGVPRTTAQILRDLGVRVILSGHRPAFRGVRELDASGRR